MSNSKAKAIPITQPGDWWEAFKAKASLEGLTLSEWVGECCRARLTVGQTLNLSPRAKRGRVAYKGPPAGIEKPTELPPPPPATRSYEQ